MNIFLVFTVAQEQTLIDKTRNPSIFFKIYRNELTITVLQAKYIRFFKLVLHAGKLLRTNMETDTASNLRVLIKCHYYQFLYTIFSNFAQLSKHSVDDKNSHHPLSPVLLFESEKLENFINSLIEYYFSLFLVFFKNAFILHALIKF